MKFASDSPQFSYVELTLFYYTELILLKCKLIILVFYYIVFKYEA
ncbi:hypothetical protein [Leptospira noguchii]|nr:hypothetical protein [Leptospira noguchii]